MKLLVSILFIISVSITPLMGEVKKSPNVTDKWPYLYNDFVVGTLYFNQVKSIQASFNIDLVNQKIVYFEDDELIRVVNEALRVDSLILGESHFEYDDGYVYEVLQGDGSRALLKRIRVDLEAAKRGSGGGYGTGTSTDATTNITSVDASVHVGLPYNVVVLERDKGVSFKLITGYYLSNGKELLRVSKRSFRDVFNDRDVNSIIKENKLKLRNEDDLITLFKKCAS
jgi:hypothetical protein